VDLAIVCVFRTIYTIRATLEIYHEANRSLTNLFLKHDVLYKFGSLAIHRLLALTEDYLQTGTTDLCRGNHA
jgi:hypothetical protein